MAQEEVNTEGKIFAIAAIIAICSEFDLVFAEEPESGHFLKKGNTRFGRDLEVYSFMADVMGLKAFIPMFLEELVLPSRVKPAINAVKNWGLQVYQEKQRQDWLEVFED